MKDIVENRFGLDGSTKARVFAMSVKENGLLWTGLIRLYYVASAVAERAFATAAKLRAKRNLPGMNSVAMNKVIWENWDWSATGEEWSPPPEWKQSVIDVLLDPNVAHNDRSSLKSVPAAGGGPASCRNERRS